MIRIGLSLFILFVLGLNVSFSQAQFGMVKNQEFLDAAERIIFKYDHSQRPQKFLNQDGFTIAHLLQILDTTKVRPKEIWDIETIKTQYWTFSTKDSIFTKKGAFFKNGHLFSFKNNDVSLEIDPLLLLSIGSERKNNPTPFINTRGLSIKGNIGKKVFFRSSLLENQARFLPHIERRISDRNAIPGNGFYKRYQSGIFDKINGWDFLNAEGVLSFRPSEYFNATIGHGSFFFGNGYQSLLLSDYADNFFFLEFNTSIGIFNYKIIFGELAPTGSSILEEGDSLAPKKYMATHYLSVALSKKLEISLFESVIFGRENHFEFQYLNPLILYRVVEQKLDSPDNVMLGFDLSYRINNKMKAYGQLVIDEMRIKEFFNGSGWWGNKVGYQLGIKYFDLMCIDHFDVQLEYNSVRPFTYAHRSTEGLDYTVASYSHYNQELAHPLGANFREFIFIWKYRISKKWKISGKAIHTKVGKSTSTNVGQNILKPTDNRIDDFSNSIGQGDKTRINMISTMLSYQWSENYFSDLQLLYRKEQSDSGKFNIKSAYFGLSFRANLSHKKLDY